MRTVRLLIAAVLASSGLVAVGLATEAATAASSKDLTAQYGGKVIKNETFTLSGKLSTTGVRQVRLQYRSKQSSGSWSTKSTQSTDSAGRFSFSVTTSKTRYWRYYAPVSGAFAKINGNVKKVSVVSQKVSIFEISDANQCHLAFAPPTNFNTMTVFMKFYPARPGREVKVVTEKYGTYTGQQDQSGIEAITITPGSTVQNSTVQGRTSEANGAPTKYTATKTTKLTNCPLIFVPL